MKSANIAILLLAIRNYNGERTINGIIHLLKGKRSIQVIQDGFLFQSLCLFGVFQKVETSLIFANLKQLKTEKILFENNNYYQLTQRGKETLNHLLKQYPFIHWLNGWKYADVTKPFWYRLLLYVQTLSYMAVGQVNFRPIIQDYATFQWVKVHFPKKSSERVHYAKEMYEELNDILSKVPENLATIFVLKLTGVDKLGLTNEQISEQLSLHKHSIDLMLLATIHFLLNEIYANENRYRLLSLLTQDMAQSLPLTRSSKRTYELWKKGYSITEIANIRQLKINTIEDHFIEIAIADPHFPYDDFVSRALRKKIVNIVKTYGTTKLRPIKEKLPDDVTYFQIRLVLTNLGGNRREFNQ